MKNLRSNINIYSSNFILFLEQNLNVTGGGNIMMRRFFSIVLVIFLIFSGSVLAAESGPQSKTYEQEKDFIIYIFNEIYEELELYPNWNNPKLYQGRIKKVMDLLEKKYKIEHKDYYIILQVAITGHPMCPFVLTAFVGVNGEHKKPWTSEMNLGCIYPEEPPPKKYKLQVFKKQIKGVDG